MLKRLAFLFIAITLFVVYSFKLSASQPIDVDSVLQSIEDNKPTAQVEVRAIGGITEAEFRKLQEEHRLYLLIGIITATPVLLILVLFFLKQSPQFSAEYIVNGTGLVLVIQCTTFVAVYAPTTEQLTAPIGILGAIAGYLFGQVRRRRSD